MQVLFRHLSATELMSVSDVEWVAENVGYEVKGSCDDVYDILFTMGYVMVVLGCRTKMRWQHKLEMS